MSDGPKNIPASIHARLTNEARKRGAPFGEILQYYGIERFLYRLSKTPYADRFILKGGLMFYGLEIPLRRPTRDIDLLSQLENRKELIGQVIQTALAVSVPADGMRFEPSSINLQETQVDSDRNGIRAVFRGYLANAEIPMQVDFGFSDELTSEPEIISYPTLFDDGDKLQLKGYPIESIVAEKFHAIERFAAMPSRWKDYYDIWLILSSFELTDQDLRAALVKTFERRATALPSSRPAALTTEFASQHQEKWLAFLAKFELDNEEINDLSKLVDKLWAFLEWPMQEAGAAGAGKVALRWKPDRKVWAR